MGCTPGPRRPSGIGTSRAGRGPHERERYGRRPRATGNVRTAEAASSRMPRNPPTPPPALDGARRSGLVGGFWGVRSDGTCRARGEQIGSYALSTEAATKSPVGPSEDSIARSMALQRMTSSTPRSIIGPTPRREATSDTECQAPRESQPIVDFDCLPLSGIRPTRIHHRPVGRERRSYVRVVRRR